ncbi:MAG TPA: arsenite methyltransferase, partial [Deltaproteobacteria bacterium]|nr:arsenite methyltransferase [Deltaproteobacteria bacterium]
MKDSDDRAKAPRPGETIPGGFGLSQNHAPHDEPDPIHRLVRERYGTVARTGMPCCGPSCGPALSSIRVGYRPEELGSIPGDADLGLGCGNPTALVSLEEGQVVVDLGSGGGIDCFLAADKVGPTGKVIGVDMTPEMVERARDNARKGGYTNVDFRLGTIEHLPVDDATADLVISNCVINLSPDKPGVFREAFRVLKPSGRIVVSDIVLTGELPPGIKASLDAYVGCIAGAVFLDDYLGAMASAGFEEIRVVKKTSFPVDLTGLDVDGTNGAGFDPGTAFEAVA